MLILSKILMYFLPLFIYHSIHIDIDQNFANLNIYQISLTNSLFSWPINAAVT